MIQKDSISIKRTYALLKDQMFELLTKSSFEKLTLTEICAASMIPRSTFYRYFEDKYDLLRYCLQSMTEDMRLTEDVVCFKNMESIQDFLLILIHQMNTAQVLRIAQQVLLLLIKVDTQICLKFRI